MKKMFMVVAMVLSLMLAPMVFAGNTQDNNTAIGSGNQQVTGNNNYIGGSGDTINGGIHNQGGQGGAGGTGIGGNASVGDVIGVDGDVKAYGGDANVGNGIGNFSPSAKIEKGAVDIDNTANNEGVTQTIIDNTVVEDNREMVGAAGFVQTGSADYRGPWNSGPQVVKVSELLNYQTSFTSAVTAKSGLFEGVRVRFRPAVDVLPEATDEILIGNKGGMFLGFMYAQATGDEADTYLVLQKAMAEAMKKGGSFAILVGEGFTTDTDTKGGGIGLSYTQSFISTDQKSSGAGAGGTGFSWAKSGPETKPWVQFAVFSK